MTLNSSIHYANNQLNCDDVPIQDIVNRVGTPVYIYSLKRIIANYRRIQEAFAWCNAHIHYSAKANSNLTILRILLENGAGIDTVSGGEIHKAIVSGAQGKDIVFAGVGKTPAEIRYALEQHVGWFNIENIEECRIINTIAESLGISSVQVALRLNPDVHPDTHPYISTGHGGAKFGLSADTIRDILNNRHEYPHLDFAGVHVHIGSQLNDTKATQDAFQKTLDLIRPFENIHTINIGGGIPIPYHVDSSPPDLEAFSESLKPYLKGYKVIIEPGRYIVGDAGVLITQIQFVKKQAGHQFYIVDASMTELIRPALYQAHHEIIPLTKHPNAENSPVVVVGPVCESADVLNAHAQLPEMKPEDYLAILTTGAYGMVMASNYNSRPRPAEVAVDPIGKNWHIVRERETWEDLIATEAEITKTR